MISKKFSILNYYQKGENPKLLIHSGTHGDEYEVIPFVTEYIKDNEEVLPDFVYVPEVSPSAVNLKTRVNKNGSDLNRKFFEGTKDDEAIANIEFHSKFKFDFCIDFHEDPEFKEFYLYDSQLLNPELLENLQNSIKSKVIDLFSGIDDPNDPDLGFEFKNGYRSFKDEKSDPMAGTFWSWSLTSGIANRVLVAEVPGLLPKAKKEELVKVLFEKLLLPLV